MKIINIDKRSMLIAVLGALTIVLFYSGVGCSSTSPWFELSTNNDSPSNGTWVWTGTEILIWGGQDMLCKNSGFRYNPSKDQWTPMTTVGAPLPRCYSSSVWTGNKMIVWGGVSFDGPTGGIYDPASDTWMTISTENSPSISGPAVWTGQEMIVWDGTDGGIYGPKTDSWRSMSMAEVDSGKQTGTWCWTGKEMLSNEWLYNPTTDFWRPKTPYNLGNEDFCVCTDKEQICIFGLNQVDGVKPMNAKYDFVTEQWTPLSSVNMPPLSKPYMDGLYKLRCSTAVAWTGTEFWFVGGYPGGGRFDVRYPPTPFLDGGRYNPTTDTWQSTPSLPRDIGTGPSAWTGKELVFLYERGGLGIKLNYEGSSGGNNQGSGGNNQANSGNNQGNKSIIITVAGNGNQGYTGDGGPATLANINAPRSVAVDSSGNLYIADENNYCIRKVDTSGIITTVAGGGTYSYYGDGWPATYAKLNWPTGVAVDNSGNIYIADTDNHRIRKVYGQ